MMASQGRCSLHKAAGMVHSSRVEPGRDGYIRSIGLSGAIRLRIYNRCEVRSYVLRLAQLLVVWESGMSIGVSSIASPLALWSVASLPKGVLFRVIQLQFIWSFLQRDRVHLCEV